MPSTNDLAPFPKSPEQMTPEDYAYYVRLAMQRARQQTGQASGQPTGKKIEQPTGQPTGQATGEETVPETSSAVVSFGFPARPNFGSKGREINLRANYFPVLQSMAIHRYRVEIKPDKCSKDVNRKIIDAFFRETSRIFPAKQIVSYDGRRYLYSNGLLPFRKETLEFALELPDQTIEIIIKWEEEIDSSVRSSDVLRATDTILRQGSTALYTQIGRSFVCPPSDPSLSTGRSRINPKMSGGRELWNGYYQSVKPTTSGTLVNIDVSSLVFYTEQPMIDLFAQLLNIPVEQLKDKRTFPLSNAQHQLIASEIVPLQVLATHTTTYQRKYRIRELAKSAETQTFVLEDDNGVALRECTVAEYFSEKYNITLAHPHLPCLKVGKKTKNTFLPLEVCHVVAGQRCFKLLTEDQSTLMIRGTAPNAPARQKEIEEMVRRVKEVNDPLATDFGICVDPQMVTLKGRVLPAPLLSTGSNGVLKPVDGSWSMARNTMYRGVQIRKWAIACLSPESRVSRRQLQSFVNTLRIKATMIGIRIPEGPMLSRYVIDGSGDLESLLKHMKKTLEGLQLIVVVLDGRTTSIYADVKRIGDTVIGIPTQCVQGDNVIKASHQTLINICLKVNVKLGGMNTVLHPSSRFWIRQNCVIFLGANISHPQHGNTGRPSTTAVVGSLDFHPSRYAATVRVQESHLTIIEDMADMVRELLLEFYRATLDKPERIVMYRDGTSESHFFHMLQHELRAIRRACQTLEKGYEPAITYIAIQRKHHTRLFPVNARDQTGNGQNMPSGTVVDVGITHPTDFDFYLAAHVAIGGTTRPSHYHVLWDDSRASADELQTVTNDLCHTYAACTRAVRLPAPAYYASLVSIRARQHLIGFNDDDRSEDSKEDSKETPMSLALKAVKVHEDTANSMYFA